MILYILIYRDTRYLKLVGINCNTSYGTLNISTFDIIQIEANFKKGHKILVILQVIT